MGVRRGAEEGSSGSPPGRRNSANTNNNVKIGKLLMTASPSQLRIRQWIRYRITPCSLQAYWNRAGRRAEEGKEDGSRGAARVGL